MGEPPALHYHLPARQPGTFGTSIFGKATEWITTTWLRFNIFICWIVLLLLILFAPEAPEQSSKIALLLVSPFAAPILYLAFVLASWIAYFIPATKFVFGYARMFYLWLFCRLIVQQAPIMEVPVWSSGYRK